MKIHSLRKSLLFIRSFLNPGFNGARGGGVIWVSLLVVCWGFVFIFRKEKGTETNLSEISTLHFSVVLRSFASCFSFPFSTQSSETGILMNIVQPSHSAWDGVSFAGLLPDRRILGIFTIWGKRKKKRTTVFLLKCIEWIKFLFGFDYFIAFLVSKVFLVSSC